jgi:hypothetical protein
MSVLKDWPCACLLALAACGPYATEPAPAGVGSPDAGSAGGGAAPAPNGANGDAQDAGGSAAGATPQQVVVVRNLHCDGVRASVVRARNVHAKTARYGQLVVISDKEDATGGAREDRSGCGTVDVHEVRARDIHVNWLEAGTVYAHSLKKKDKKDNEEDDED